MNPDKRTGLNDALSAVRDGHTVALGGMTLYRRPVAAALALAAAGRRDLEIVTLTGGIETDLLIGAGCVRRLRSCYTGLEVAGFAPHFTRGVQDGTLELIEETEYTLSYGVQAAAMRVPFLPMRGDIARTDLPKVRPDLKAFACPLTGATLFAVPALHVDVAILHASAADRFGNCSLQGQLALDRHLPAIADITIVTAETIVEPDELRAMDGGVQLPGIFVTHLVEVPGGSLPTSCFPQHPLDLAAVLDYADAAGTAGTSDSGAWQQWLETATGALV
ncbi:coenzyme A transferase family protein [Paraburkholderia xenovorans LB400]|uniref:Acyl CoA-transferase subunit A n=1 Tax=Paraburkholderia xenovorans (strain LB400) TaxID=266265 RepID=Q140M6_PARXL|nr:CoA-transferase [Paraburkholderia xenovorans]ABE30213.1 Putative acyl CoA-transferase subunit A [Paraburkholderia xenovorans LB400]AIP30461.1 coenzyme A transferase family protein [Paraburkholderia xenovorans LB400]